MNYTNTYGPGIFKITTTLTISPLNPQTRPEFSQGDCVVTPGIEITNIDRYTDPSPTFGLGLQWMLPSAWSPGCLPTYQSTNNPNDCTVSASGFADEGYPADGGGYSNESGPPLNPQQSITYNLPATDIPINGSLSQLQLGVQSQQLTWEQLI